ncbi:MAG TPA: hypothetical protein VHS36_06335 [Candidatus Limnocylindrales bacterium]|jgi:hypothetical protein|nr:hypothetical protein [Candidatus Limnocylindrales bacterium]
MIALSRSSRTLGRVRAPREAMNATAIITTPAIENRTAPMTNGGNVTTATRIARYVEPQTTYRIRIEVQTRAVEAFLGGAPLGIAGWSKVLGV